MSPIALLALVFMLGNKSDSTAASPGNPTAQTLDDDNLLVRFDDGSVVVLGVNYGFAANVNNATTIALRYGDRKGALAKWQQLRPQLQSLPPGDLQVKVLVPERVTGVYGASGVIIVFSAPSVFRVAADHKTIARVFAGSPQQAAATWAKVRSQLA